MKIRSFMGSSHLQSDAYQRFLPTLRQWRERAGMSQVVLAEKLGKPQNFVSRYEIGERRVDAVELMRILLALGLTWADAEKPLLDALKMERKPVRVLPKSR